MPNRRLAPPLKQLDDFVLTDFKVHHLDNGIPVYEINKGTQEILKLEVIFFAGRWYEDKQLAARATARLIKEGTSTLSSAEIAETIDFYGGTFRTSSNMDTSSVTLFCLTKHFEKLLPLLKEVLVNPSFPEKELKTYVENQNQRLKVELTKNEVVAYRELTSAFFGNDHPYGYNSSPEMYRALETKDLQRHFANQYISENCHIILSGKTSPEILSNLNAYLGKSIASGQIRSFDHVLQPYLEKKIELDIPGSVQSAIRLGQIAVGRKHEDYPGLFVLNTILGGYFGSRLMSNLREDKGYTYGIYSSIDSLLRSSYLYVGSEVASEVTSQTLDEIYKEFRTLRENPIPEKELQKVRNYMMGVILNSLDGPFNVAAVIKTLILENVDTSFLDNLLKKIQTVTPAELQILAQKYLREEDMYEVIVR
ncbi:MAG: pitrilysin family protein [Bacteroidota bacterium]